MISNIIYILALLLLFVVLFFYFQKPPENVEKFESQTEERLHPNMHEQTPTIQPVNNSVISTPSCNYDENIEKWKKEMENVQNLIKQTSSDIIELQKKLEKLQSEDAWSWKQQLDILQNKMNTDLQNLDVWKINIMTQLHDENKCDNIILERDTENMQNIQLNLLGLQNIIKGLYEK